MTRYLFLLASIFICFYNCASFEPKIAKSDFYSLYSPKESPKETFSEPVLTTDKDQISYKCRNYPISKIISQVSDHFKLNVSYPGQIYGTVSLNVSKMAYGDFIQLVLSSGNYKAVMDGKNLQIKRGEASGSLTKEISLNYLNAKTLCSALKDTYDSDFKFTLVAEHNSIIVSGDAEAVFNLEKTVGMLDKPAPSILLEIILLEINKSHFEAYGISLGDLANKRLFVSSVNSSESGTGNIVENLQLKDSDSDDIPSDFIFKANIRALKQRGLAKVVTHPHVVSRSGEEAVVDVSLDNYLYVQKQSDDAETYFFDVEKVSTGVTLKMTPVLTNSGALLINFHAEESNVLPPENNANFIVDRNTLQSTLRAESGDVIVAGGLVQKFQSGSRVGVPILSKIPIVNLFFNRRNREKNTKEIVFFILPKIFYHEYRFMDNSGPVSSGKK